MSNIIKLQLFHPKGDLQTFVQAIWFAQADQEGLLWLPCDGSDGIVMPLYGKITLDGTFCTNRYYIQTATPYATALNVSADSCFCGIRFQPGIYRHLNDNQHPLVQPEQLTMLAKQMQVQPSLKMFQQLLTPVMHFAQLPATIGHILSLIKRITAMEPLSLAYQQIPLSQRQLERQVKKQCGMTPKRLTRIYRVRKVKTILQQQPFASLAAIAHSCHFADQAHLQREFKALLGLTPKRYASLIASQPKVLKTVISDPH